MWSLRSLSHLTDLFLTSFDGEVIDRGDHVIVRTPSNPGFAWGNFLLFPEPPDAGAARTWRETFARELPDAVATLFMWDRPDGTLGDVQAFLDDGFSIDDGVVLTATPTDLVRPPRTNDTVQVEPLTSDAHWTEAARALVNAFTPRRYGTVDDLRLFVDRQLTRYRRMQAARIGQWYGAFVEGTLAGTLGLVRVPLPSGEAVGRFQLVGVDPAFGRRGVCSALVHEVAARAFAEQRFASLVMAADDTYHAARVYESVGFRKTELLKSLIRRPAAA